MQYSNTSTKDGILQRTEFYLGFDDGRITGNSDLKNIINGLVNSEYLKLTTAIFESQDSWDGDDPNYTNFSFSKASLVASRRDYSFPDILKLQRVDITYDGDNWYRATAIDSKELSAGLGDDTDIDGDFSKTSPRYDVFGDSVLIYPRASTGDVTAGAKVRIEYLRKPSLFVISDTTKEPKLIAEPFQEMIPLGTALRYAIAKRHSTAPDLKALYDDYEVRFRRFYHDRQEDHPIVLSANYVNYN